MIKNNHHYSKDEIENLARVKPGLIELHLTNFCNHACSWCVADEVRQNKWHFSYENAEKLIREFAESGVHTVIYSGGGDPFMFKGTEKLLELGHSLGMKNNLITNGFGLNEKTIPIVAKTCQLVRISVDSGNKETHSLIHRPKNLKIDNFDVITEKIGMLTKEVRDKNTKTEVMLTFVVIDESINSIEEFLDLAERLGVTSVDFKTNHFWSAERKHEVYKKIEKIILNRNSSVKIHIEYPKSREGELSDEIWSTFLISAVVEANGALYPCCHKSPQIKWYMGNVLDNGFKEAWAGVKRQEVLQRVLNEKHSCPTCLDTDFNRNINQYADKYGIEILTKSSGLLSI